VIVNSGQIDVKADARAPVVSVAVAVQIGGAAISTSTATSSATAIDAGDGNDQVLNTGKLMADAYSLAVGVNGSGADKGVAIAANDSWNGGIDAAARARGIDGGAGLDLLTNDAEISAKSQATSPAVTAAIVTSTGAAAAVSTSTAKATSTAIDAGGGVEGDQIINLNFGGAHAGKLTADASAMAFTANVAITNQGLAVAADAVWDGGTKAEANGQGYRRRTRRGHGRKRRRYRRDFERHDGRCGGFRHKHRRRRRRDYGDRNVEGERDRHG
jgi:hypothetical protein